MRLEWRNEDTYISFRIFVTCNTKGKRRETPNNNNPAALMGGVSMAYVRGPHMEKNIKEKKIKRREEKNCARTGYTVRSRVRNQR